jgi:predicted N-acetyltransferase YhbS
MLTVSEEKAVDYQATARLATEAFASNDVVFSADRMRWLYERGFSQGTTVLALTDDGVKIGQIALVHLSVQCDGKSCSAVQLVDLFVARDRRSPQLIRRLYKEVEQVCVDRKIRFIVAVPNQNARLLNARFLKLKPLALLQLRAGFALRPPRLAKLHYSGAIKSLKAEQAIALLSGFDTPTAENGLRWDGEALFNRLNDPTCDFAVHAGAELMLISSSRRTRGVNHTLLCGFFARSPGAASAGRVRELVRAACHFWKRPLFVYAGVNDKLAKLPGIALPERLRPPVLVQFRDFNSEETGLQFNRFQLIDSDFV